MGRLIGDLSMDRRCEISDLPEAMCGHCRGSEEIDLSETDFEVIGTFEARYPGRCVVDPDHQIRRGDTIARVRHSGNPFVPVSGYACSACRLALPRGMTR